jgi:hypothetical protein
MSVHGPIVQQQLFPSQEIRHREQQDMHRALCDGDGDGNGDGDDGDGNSDDYDEDEDEDCHEKIAAASRMVHFSDVRPSIHLPWSRRHTADIRQYATYNRQQTAGSRQ